MPGKQFSAPLAGALVMLFAAGSILSTRADAQQERVLRSLSNNGLAAGGPYGGVIFDGAGNLYGTTINSPSGSGLAFEMTPKGNGIWATKTLYDFAAHLQSAGVWPSSKLMFDGAGNLYGTTPVGGAHDGGAVYELSRQTSGSWIAKTLYSFNLAGGDGYQTVAGVIIDSSGNLYGTTQLGGAHNGGMIFELLPQAEGTWTEQILYSFCSLSRCADGMAPYGDLVLDAAGNLYGTTYKGGTYTSGTVFELSPHADGNWTETVLHSFNPKLSNGTGDGFAPLAGLIFDAAGNLYGTTASGGSQWDGTVFELSPQVGGGWTESILHVFDFQKGDGWQPRCDLALDGEGNIYGTTQYGGAYNSGTVFKLTPVGGGAWSETILHSFPNNNGVDGSQPYSGVTLDAVGNLYGTTFQGGSANGGTVFEITP